MTNFTIRWEDGSPEIEALKPPGGKGYMAVVCNPDGTKHHRHGMWAPEGTLSFEAAKADMADWMLDCPKCEAVGVRPLLAEVPGRVWHPAVDKE